MSQHARENPEQERLKSLEHVPAKWPGHGARPRLAGNRDALPGLAAWEAVARGYRAALEAVIHAAQTQLWRRYDVEPIADIARRALVEFQILPGAGTENLSSPLKSGDEGSCPSVRTARPTPGIQAFKSGQDSMRPLIAKLQAVIDDVVANQAIAVERAQRAEAQLASRDAEIKTCWEALVVVHKYLMQQIGAKTLNDSAKDGTQATSRMVSETLDALSATEGRG
jgi:hypothetical protein